jgi:hypothetical protein
LTGAGLAIHGFFSGAALFPLPEAMVQKKFSD